VYEISKTLQVNLTLKQLFLCSNNIGVGGALSIAVALCHNHTLEDLFISNNKILDDGVIAIAECLKTNKALKFLDLVNNNITEIGAIEIMEVLKLNSVFQRLKIDKKCVEILKPYTERFLYNETVARHYHIKVNQVTTLIRVWTP